MTVQCLPFKAPAFEETVAELYHIMHLSFPLILSCIIEIGLPVITLAAVGHLGIPQLDGIAVGAMTGNITGASLLIGLAMAMDTLGSQAYGARNYERVGVLVQRAFCVCLLLCIPILLLWWNIEPVLIFLGQAQNVSHLASSYLRILSLYLVPLVTFELAKKFLAVQGIVAPVTCIMFIACFFHTGMLYLLIWGCGLGFIGAPYAMAATLSFMATLGVGYICFSSRCFPSPSGVDPHCCWGGWSWEAFQEWGSFLRLGVAAVAQVCLEWWAFEVLVMISGNLGPIAIAVNAIAMQMSLFVFDFPFGVSIACSIRVGQHLGSNCGAAARRSALVALFFGTLLSIVVITMLFLGRRTFAKLFTTDEEVTALAERVLWLVAFSGIFDNVQVICGGALRGAGLQLYAAIVNFVGLWLVGIPLAAFLALSGNGVFGLWCGFASGMMLIAVGELAMIVSIDWDKLAGEAHARATSHLTEHELLLPPAEPLAYGAALVPRDAA